MAFSDGISFSDVAEFSRLYIMGVLLRLVSFLLLDVVELCVAEWVERNQGYLLSKILDLHHDNR